MGLLLSSREAAGPPWLSTPGLSKVGSASASSEYLAALCPSETCNEMSHPLLDFDQVHLAALQPFM